MLSRKIQYGESEDAKHQVIVRICAKTSVSDTKSS
jgi:hypothetical protein